MIKSGRLSTGNVDRKGVWRSAFKILNVNVQERDCLCVRECVRAYVCVCKSSILWIVSNMRNRDHLRMDWSEWTDLKHISRVQRQMSAGSGLWWRGSCGRLQDYGELFGFPFDNFHVATTPYRCSPRLRMGVSNKTNIGHHMNTFTLISTTFPIVHQKQSDNLCT